LIQLLNIGFFYHVNESHLDKSISRDKRSFSLISEITANSIFSGYFQWEDMYSALLEKNTDKIQGYFQEIRSMSPYVKDIRIINQKPAGEYEHYSLVGKNNDLFIYFKVFDGARDNVIGNQYIQVQLDSELILYHIQLNQDIVISDSGSGRNFLYNIKVEPAHFSLYLYQILIGIILGILCTFTVEVIHTQYFSYFYDTRGLEKIIFLFEKAEKYSASHSKQVAKIATYIGRKAGLKGKKLRDLTVAAFLHDIGKISVPVALLNKKEKLSEDEFDEIKKHVIYSAEIIQNFEELSHLKDIVLYHHEKMDGSGYPSGIKGDEIPFESRIIAVSDIFEALIGKRPYREPMNPESAIALMKGISLDPGLFKILQENLNDIVRLTSYKDNVVKKVSNDLGTIPA